MAFPDELNPFDEIINFEEKRPHRRTINSNFTTKIKDAFNVISGSSLGGDKFNFGLYGWLTLFIPTVLELASFVIAQSIIETFNTLKDSNPVLLFIKSPFLAVGILGFGSIFLALIGSRFLISAILTVASMPIIAMVAGISALVKKHYENKLLDSTVTVEVIEGTNVRSSRESTLREALAETKTPIQSLRFPKKTEGTYKFNLLEKTITLDTTNSDIKDAAKNLNLIPLELVKFD